MTATERLDPRVERTRRVVLDAAATLLTDHGFDQITIDAIAEQSGVARSTIYRNWPDRADLLRDAFEVVCGMPPTPDQGSLVGDFRAKAEQIANGLEHEAWGRMVPSLVGAADHDLEIRTAQKTFSDGRRAQALALVARAVERGEVDAAADAGSAVERFIAGFFFRRLMTYAPLDTDFVEAQLEALCRDLGTTYSR